MRKLGWHPNLGAKRDLNASSCYRSSSGRSNQLGTKHHFSRN